MKEYGRKCRRGLAFVISVAMLVTMAPFATVFNDGTDAELSENIVYAETTSGSAVATPPALTPSALTITKSPAGVSVPVTVTVDGEAAVSGDMVSQGALVNVIAPISTEDNNYGLCSLGVYTDPFEGAFASLERETQISGGNLELSFEASGEETILELDYATMSAITLTGSGIDKLSISYTIASSNPIDVPVSGEELRVPEGTAIEVKIASGYKATYSVTVGSDPTQIASGSGVTGSFSVPTEGEGSGSIIIDVDVTKVPSPKKNNSKGSSGSSNVTETIPSEWEYYNFSNSQRSFTSNVLGTLRYNIDNAYMTKMHDNLKKIYDNEAAANAMYSEIKNYVNTVAWGGSCFGFATTEGLLNYGAYKVNEVDTDATKISDIDAPVSNRETRNIINFYHMTQFIDAEEFQDEMHLGVVMRNGLVYYQQRVDFTDSLEKLIDEVEKRPVLLGYYFAAKEMGQVYIAGHAIILESVTKNEDGTYSFIGRDNRFPGTNGEGVTDLTIDLKGNGGMGSFILTHGDNSSQVEDILYFHYNSDFLKYARLMPMKDTPSRLFTVDEDGRTIMTDISRVVERAPLFDRMAEFKTYTVAKVEDISKLFVNNDTNNENLVGQDSDVGVDILQNGVFKVSRNGGDVSNDEFNVKYNALNDENVMFMADDYILGSTVEGDEKTIPIYEIEEDEDVIALFENNSIQEQPMMLSGRGADGFGSVSADGATAMFVGADNSVAAIEANGKVKLTLGTEGGGIITLIGSASGEENDDFAASERDDEYVFIAPEGTYTITVTEADGSETSYIVTSDGEEAIVATKSADGTIHVNGEKTLPDLDWDTPFSDVKDRNWFFNAVGYVYINGLFSGTTDTTFSPGSPMTRGMLMTVLHRLDGSPEVSEEMPEEIIFSDVKSGKWYTDAVLWAVQEGITNGRGDGTFGVNDPVNREDIAVFLYRYAQYKDVDVSSGEDTNILSYNDAFDISDYAFPALQWACTGGLIEGMGNGNLNPGGAATRAEVAKILAMYHYYQ